MCPFKVKLINKDKRIKLDEKVLHGEITDEKTIKSIGSDIRSICKYDQFIPTWSYLFTWFVNAVSFKGNSTGMNYSNMFQLLLTSNGNVSFAIFNFVRLEWPNDFDAFNNFFIHIGSLFVDRSRVVIAKSTIINDQLVFLNDSSMRNKLIEESNMDRPGRWFASFDDANCQL